MKITETFYEILKSWGAFYLVFLVPWIIIIIWLSIALSLELTFYRVFVLFGNSAFAALVISVIAVITSALTNLLRRFFYSKGIPGLQDQLQQFKLKLKYSPLHFGYEGEIENKKFGIYVLPVSTGTRMTSLIIYRLYHPFYSTW